MSCAARALAGGLAILVASACSGDGSTDCEPGLAEDGTLTLAAGEVCVRGVQIRVRGDGPSFVADETASVQLDEIDNGVVVTVSSTAGGVRGFELLIPELSADRLLQQGYQSWGYSGGNLIPPSVPMHDDGAPLLAAFSGDVADEKQGVSYGATVLGGENAPYLVIGAASAQTATTGIAAWVSEDVTTVSVVYGAAREPLPVANGEVSSEPIAFISSYTPQEGLEALALQMSAALPADSRTPKRPPGGWFSWNQHYEEIDQEFIRDHIGRVSDLLVPHGMNLLEIDDGWMEAWGDWRENGDFSDGLDVLAAEIDAAGLIPGVWLAPFLVDVDSDVVETIDPAMFVRDEQGDPIEHQITGFTRTFYILDGTNEDSMALATDAVERLSNAGYRFFKFDFLYAGAVPGARSEAVTGNQALRSGMQMLLTAAGPDATVNACGVPIWPIMGLADSLRVGPDTAFADAELSLPLLSSAARSFAARQFLSELIWPDADQTQVRQPYNQALADMSPVIAALAGPAYALGDDLTALPSERLSLTTDATILDLAASDIAARPVGLLDDPANGVIISPLIEAFTTPTYTRSPPPVRFEARGGLTGNHYEISFEWDEPYGVTVDQVQL